MWMKLLINVHELVLQHTWDAYENKQMKLLFLTEEIVL